MRRDIAYTTVLLFASSPAQAQDAGLPQTDVSTYPSQIFWLGVCFIALYVLMSRLSLPRVAETLERRRTQKDGDLKLAAGWNEEAEKIRAQYEKSLAKAQSTAAATIATAERAVSNKIAEEQSKFADNSRKRLALAEQNIAKAKVNALSSLSDIAADIAADMVQKIADVQVNKADAKKMVVSAMKEG